MGGDRFLVRADSSLMREVLRNWPWLEPAPRREPGGAGSVADGSDMWRGTMTLKQAAGVHRLLTPFLDKKTPEGQAYLVRAMTLRAYLEGLYTLSALLREAKTLDETIQ